MENVILFLVNINESQHLEKLKKLCKPQNFLITKLIRGLGIWFQIFFTISSDTDQYSNWECVEEIAS